MLFHAGQILITKGHQILFFISKDAKVFFFFLFLFIWSGLREDFIPVHLLLDYFLYVGIKQCYLLLLLLLSHSYFYVNFLISCTLIKNERETLT